LKPKRRYYKEYDYVYYTIKYSQILHREDGPALHTYNGTRGWYRYGVLHRVDGPAAITINNGLLWCINGFCFKTKEEWFEKLPEEQKAKMLFSEYFIK
jgi:hypothetical protein